MSKLALVICAATFFTLAIAATLNSVDRSKFHSAIDRAVGTIAQCAQDVHQKMLDLGPQPLNMHSDILDEYEANITNTISEVRSEVRDILKTVQLRSDKKKCSKYFTDFEAIGKDLADNSLMAMTMDFMDLIDSVREVSILSGKKQQELNDAKLNPCARSNCNTFGNNVSIEAVVSQFCSHSRGVTEEYVAMVNGTRTRNMLYSSAEYRSFISKGNVVVKETLSCVSSIGLSEGNDIAVFII